MNEEKQSVQVTADNNPAPDTADKIKVSVIVPVYKDEKYIERCLYSLINQSLKEMEFIFIDDCGGDNSISIVEKEAASDNRIRIIYNKKNIGAGFSRNKGIESAHGEYLGFVDADDEVDLNFYEKLYALALKYNSDVSKGQRINYLLNGTKQKGLLTDSLSEFGEYAERQDWFYYFDFEHQTAIYRRDLIKKENIRYSNTLVAQDTMFLLQMMYYAHKVAFCHDAYYHYYIREDSLSTTRSASFYEANIQNFDERIKFLCNHPAEKDVVIQYVQGRVDYLLTLYQSIAGADNNRIRYNFLCGMEKALDHFIYKDQLSEHINEIHRLTEKLINSEIKEEDFKNMYPIYDEIYADTTNGFSGIEFKEKLIQYHDSLIMDKVILENKNIVIQYDEFCEVPEGRFTVIRDDVRMESLFISCPLSDKLFVVLLGARMYNGAMMRIPRFDMWSWSRQLNVNYLCIEDPMYFKYNDPPVTTGWYYGDENINYREYIANLIEKICNIKDINIKNIKIYGTSAGGSAAIGVAEYLEGISVIAHNAQLDFKNYNPSQFFSKTTGIDIIENSEDGKRNDLVSIIKKNKSKFLYMVNAYSLADTDLHLKLLVEKYNFTPKLGINTLSDNFTVWIYQAPGAMSEHQTVPSHTLMLTAFWLTDLMQQEKNIAAMQRLFLHFTQFHFYEYELKRQLWSSYRTLKNRNKLLLTAAGKNLKIIAFGTQYYFAYKIESVKKDFYPKFGYSHFPPVKIIPDIIFVDKTDNLPIIDGFVLISNSKEYDILQSVQLCESLGLPYDHMDFYTNENCICVRYLKAMRCYDYCDINNNRIIIKDDTISDNVTIYRIGENVYNNVIVLSKNPDNPRIEISSSDAVIFI